MREHDERPTDAQDAVVADEDGDTVETSKDEQLEPGTDVGGYVVDGVLGKGGMGTVYSATHPVIGKRAAIKVLKHELSANPAAVERFVIEARAVNQIGHHNIVDIFAFDRLPDGRSYYVMDLMTGESLRRRLKRTGAMHVSEAVVAIDEIASALIAAHGKGIIHRDLKPDNIFMVQMAGRWPEVKILDWGLLKLTQPVGKYRTVAGSVMGTPVYMSPEQARASDQIDARSDIYSLGVIAYELLTGSVPFRKGTSIDTLLAHQDEPVPPLAENCPGLPDEIVQLIEAMLAKEPGDRPTLTAVRAVIKRLRGTKIPTMTAAGLEIDPLPSSPLQMEPLPELSARPMQRARTPTQETVDEGLDQDVTVPRLRATPVPGSLPLPAPPRSGIMPGQSSPSMPYQSISIAQTTLAGHTMPSATVHRTPVNNPPAVYPQGSVPPRSEVGSAPFSSAMSASRLQSARSMRRLVVILVAAILVTAAGIVVVVTVL